MLEIVNASQNIDVKIRQSPKRTQSESVSKKNDIISNKSESYKKETEPSFLRKSAGFIAGSAVFSNIFFRGKKFIASTFMKTMSNIKETVPIKDIDAAAKEMVERSGINKKGFRYSFVNSANFDETAESIFYEVANKPLIKFTMEKSKNAGEKLVGVIGAFAKNMAWAVKEGKNAFFLPNSNLAIAGEQKAFAILHEIGHGINANSSRLSHTIIKTNRLLAGISASIIAFIGLTHTTNNKNNENNGLKAKTQDFIKNNAGKLTLLSIAPMIFEEGLASFHGLKFAKNVLGKTANLGSLKKLYGFGFASYIATAGLTALAVKSSIILKDKIVQPKQK